MSAILFIPHCVINPSSTKRSYIALSCGMGQLPGSCNMVHYIDGLVQDNSNSTAHTLELLQSSTKPMIYMRIA